MKHNPGYSTQLDHRPRFRNRRQWSLENILYSARSKASEYLTDFTIGREFAGGDETSRENVHYGPWFTIPDILTDIPGRESTVGKRKFWRKSPVYIKVYKSRHSNRLHRRP